MCIKEKFEKKGKSKNLQKFTFYFVKKKTDNINQQYFLRNFSIKIAICSTKKYT